MKGFSFLFLVTATLSTNLAASCLEINLADLSGSIVSKVEGRATITNNSKTCDYLIGLASYSKFGRELVQQKLFDSQRVVILAGQTLDLQVKMPPCAAQLDLVAGEVLENFETSTYGKNWGDKDRKIDYANLWRLPLCK